MTSRSDMIPAIRPPSSTGRAPILFSPRRRTASCTDESPLMVSITLPLSRSTAAMVMAHPPDSPAPHNALVLIVPLWAVKGKVHDDAAGRPHEEKSQE